MIYLACVIALRKSVMEESEASLWQYMPLTPLPNAISESRFILESSYQINAQVKSVAASCAFRLQRSCDYACQLKVRAILPLLAKEHGFPQRKDCVQGLFCMWNGPHLLRSSVHISAIQQSSLMLIQTRSSLHLACRLKNTSYVLPTHSHTDGCWQGHIFFFLH